MTTPAQQKLYNEWMAKMPAGQRNLMQNKELIRNMQEVIPVSMYRQEKYNSTPLNIGIGTIAAVGGFLLSKLFIGL